MANPRIPYFFPEDRPALNAPAGGPIVVHLVVNVEHWQFGQPMPRTIVTPPHGKETIPDVPNFGWADYACAAACRACSARLRIVACPPPPASTLA
jgi:hypothetical protein